MMQIVMYPHSPEYFRWIGCMHLVMNVCVEHVPEQPSCQERECERAKHQLHNQRYHTDNDQARNGRHKKPVVIPGSFMVNTVKCIREALCQLRFRNEMEDVAVHDVFEECPEHETAH